MSKKGQTPLRFAQRVTPKHGAAFVNGWRVQSNRSGLMRDALAETGIIEFPDPDAFESEAQRRYSALVDEILERTFAAVRDFIAEAFVKAANDVLSRERKTRRGKRRG